MWHILFLGASLNLVIWSPNRIPERNANTYAQNCALVYKGQGKVQNRRIKYKQSDNIMLSCFTEVFRVPVREDGDRQSIIDIIDESAKEEAPDTENSEDWIESVMNA